MTEGISLYTRKVRKEFEAMLKKLVEIPSVSADPARKTDIQRTADVAEKLLLSEGADAQQIQTKGNPVVVGLFAMPGARSAVTIYNHLDVQPADEPEWKRDPFIFKKQGDKYFGRGSTDDKGPALTALLAARYAKQNRIPINIQFVWELEEEIGSPHFEEFLKKQKDELKTDSVVVIDSVWVSAKRPCIFYALRGNITGSMILETAGHAVHSGVTGGVARNPLFELCKVAAQCYDADSSKILIPGFYEGIVEPTPAELSNFRKSGFRLKEWAKSYGLKKIQVKDRDEAFKRIWCRPTFEVVGITGGYTGPGVKTAIPGRAELKFSCRLAPNQNPKQICKQLKAHIRKINPDVRVHFHSALRPYLGAFSGSYAQVASDAFLHGFSRRPAFARAGGSDGAIILLQEYLKAPITLMGLSLPEHGYHAPNEYFDWGQAAGGIKTLVKYFELAAKL
ncbi:M20/M25/M40 family metallo-hydrolase [bacterium]|nr:M20/M25/M40 family metallo-hydrolase [bacterium]MCI0603357.1 M20/M25/M40 family metallo-hydrolase [bacterium]